jgi:hypothetical protein
MADQLEFTLSGSTPGPDITASLLEVFIDGSKAFEADFLASPDVTVPEFANVRVIRTDTNSSGIASDPSEPLEFQAVEPAGPEKPPKPTLDKATFKRRIPG